MTTLTTEQKAEIAELLGWRYVDDGVVYPHWRKGTAVHYGPSPITLEALLAYCREQYKYHCLIRTREGYDAMYGTPLNRVGDPDPLTALSLAVLAAHEQEKANA